MELLRFTVRNPLVLLDNNMTPQEIEYLKSQGVDPSQYEEVGEYEEVTPPAQQPQEQGIIGKAWETINTPLTAYAPDAFRNMVRQGISYNPLGDAIMRKIGIPDPVIRGVNNVESDIGESMLSPLSLATLGSAGLLRQVPKFAGFLGGAFGLQSGYNLAQRPGQFAEAKGDLQKQTEAVLGGVADLASAGLGGLQAHAGYRMSRKPPVIPKDQGQIVQDTSQQISSDDFYANEINDPLPTPWTAEGSPEIAQTVQGLPKSGRLVSNKAVDALIQEKAPHLLTASQAVKRQFLLDNQIQFPDTPQFNRFEDGVQRSSEVETLINKAGDKITRKPGINLEGQPTEFGPLEDTFRQPQPLKSNVETVLNEQGLPFQRPVVYPNEAKSALDIGVEQSNPEPSGHKIVMKRPDRSLSLPQQLTPELPQAEIIDPGLVKPTTKPMDIDTGKSKLPVKYQEQFPGQSMEGVNPPISNLTKPEKSGRFGPPQKYHSGLPMDEIIQKAKDDFNYLRSKWGDFAPTLAKELGTLKPFGITADKEGKVSVQSLLAKMQSRVSKSEQEMLEGIGFKDYLNQANKGGKVNVVEMNDWLSENAPKIEVKKLVGNAELTTEAKRAAAIQHELETLGYQRPQGYDLREGIITPDGSIIETVATDKPGIAKLDVEDRPKLPENVAKLYEEYLDVAGKQYGQKKESNESATARYTQVNPKPLDQMPGAVDILVRIPTKLTAADRRRLGLGPNQEGEITKYSSEHYPQEGKNLIAHVRGYMETKPDGKKVFHVFEAQSDWAQYVREVYEDRKAGNVREDSVMSEKYDSEFTDPTLPYYEHLALKAAIKHAIDEGADSIAISDADTAMITEMHDQVAELKHDIVIEDAGTLPEARAKAKQLTQETGLKHYEEQVYTPNDVLWQVKREGPDYKIPQEGGMRQHYDKTLPNIAKKLTGGKDPKEVGFGPHQNAFETNRGEGDYQARQNLVIKNKQGQPKTDISAREYDLSQIKDRVKSGEPFSTYSTLYANPLGQILNEGVKGIAKGVSKLHSVDPTRPQIEKVAQKQGPTGQYAAPKFEQFYERMRKYEGEFVNSLKSTLLKGLSFKQKLLSQSSPALTKAWQYLNDVQDHGRSALTLTPEEQGYVNAIRQNLQKTGQEQINKGIPVWTAKGPRTKVLDPNYVPHLFNKWAIDVLNNKQGSPEFSNLKNKMIAYWKTRHGFTQYQATKVFNEIAESFKSTDESNKASTFGPVDKAAGLGLPLEAREMNPILAMDRFNKRISRRFAFFDVIESDPVMRKALGIKFDHLGNPTPTTVKLPSGLDVDYIAASDEVSPIMRDIEAKHAIRDIEFDALNTTLKSVVMQTLSGGVDLVTSNILGWQHQLPTQYAKATIKGISDLSKSIAEGLNEGVIRHDTVSYESTSGAIGDVIGNLQKLRTAAGMVTLRNTFEKMGRGVAFGQGKLLAADNVYKLHRNPNGIGSSQRKLFMDTFAKDINWRGRAQLTPEEISTIAGRYTESVAGTYDYRGLSVLTQDSKISPLLNWSRWSIEKKNNFVKNVVKPLEQGNYWPLIGATAGLMIGGTAVQELRKLASGGREAKSPTWKEVDKAGDRKGEALFYKLASLADASGYGGITMSIAHNLMKVRFGDKPQAMFDLPLAEFAKDNTTLLLQAVEAFEAGDLEGVDLLVKFAEANIQNARVLTSLLSEDKKKNVEHSNKVRDYKMFKELSGQHKAYDTSTPNPFLGKKEKEFKRAGVDQLRELPKLLNDAVANSVRKAEGDPFKISTNLRGLKSNPITWSPSMENNPLEFTKYIKHLKETQGPKAASEFIQNYMKQKKLNEAKSSLVPSFSP
jgi:hypothetical protein